MRTPAVFFTNILTGWKSFLFILVLAGLHIYIGVGLPRLQRFARIVGIGYFAFAILNSAVFYFTPGVRARVQQLLESQLSIFPGIQPAEFKAFLPFDITPLIVTGVIVGSVTGLIMLLVLIYFLLVSKKAFIKPATFPRG
jgi:hypothetical protein